MAQVEPPHPPAWRSSSPRPATPIRRVGTTPLSEDGLPFDRLEELTLYRQLRAIQEELPSRRSLLIARAVVRVPGRTFKPDTLVVYRGRAGIMEVDGSTHLHRWAADRSRDRLLEDAGVYYVDHLDAESASDPAECQIFAERFIDTRSDRIRTPVPEFSYTVGRGAA